MSGCKNIDPRGLLKVGVPGAQLANVHLVVSTYCGLMAAGDLSLNVLACWIIGDM